MPPIEIPTLSPGSRVTAELLVYDRAERKTNAGDPFVVLTLGNASGRIDTAPIWSNQLEWADGVRSGKIVQAIGDVTTWGKNGAPKKQLQLAGPVRVLPDELYRIEEFLPAVPDRGRLWAWLDKLRSEVEAPALRRVLDLFYGDDDFRVRFERTPASTRGHHAKLGGLLLHVCEVANIGRQISRTMGPGGRVNADLVLAGALLHDVGKVEAYEIGAGGFAHTPCGLLLGHIVLGCLMLERRIAAAGSPVCSEGQLLELQHMILSHHGALEFGSPVQPMTTEAEILHWADEASAKATDMLDALDDPETFQGGRELSDRKPWTLGRYLWKRPHDWQDSSS